MRTFAPAIERESVGRETIKIIGALVQLVRIHACHAWGHGFESRTLSGANSVAFLGLLKNATKMQIFL